MRLGYINSKIPYITVEDQKQLILGYVKSNHLTLDKIFQDDELSLDFLKNTQKKIKLLLPNVAVLGNRYEDILKMVQAYTSLNVSLYFISEQILVGQEVPNSFPIVSEICFQLYKSILSLKNKDIVANIRKSGRKPGRPFNSKNGLVTIDDRADEILALKSQGMTNLQIAVHIGCGTTTLYKFLRKHRENVRV